MVHIQKSETILKSQMSFWKYWSKHVLSVIMITTVAIVLQLQGCFVDFENAALDSWLTTLQPRVAPHVIIVDITENDYNRLFQSTSPLGPDKIYEILHAIVVGQPRIIGIALDTSTNALREQYKALQPSLSWPPIIWARDAHIVGQNTFTPAAILGGNIFDPPPLSGIALFPQDADGVVRRYRREFDILRQKEPSKEKKLDTLDSQSEAITDRMNSFPWAIVKTLNSVSVKEEEHKGLVGLNFFSRRYSIPRIFASDAIRLSSSMAWQRQGPLKGKIAILGGSFRVSQDAYVTPLGPMTVMELIAQAIEAELSGTVIRSAHKVWMILVDLVIVAVMVSLYATLSPRFAFLLTLLALPFFSLMGSWVVFSAFGYWTSYAPLLIALWIYQLYPPYLRLTP